MQIIIDAISFWIHTIVVLKCIYGCVHSNRLIRIWLISNVLRFISFSQGKCMNYLLYFVDGTFDWAFEDFESGLNQPASFDMW